MHTDTNGLVNEVQLEVTFRGGSVLTPEMRLELLENDIGRNLKHLGRKSDVVVDLAQQKGTYNVGHKEYSERSIVLVTPHGQT